MRVAHRVPSSCRREAVRVAARVIAARDISERTRVRVEEWVEEAKRGLSRGGELVVDQRNDTGRNRRGAARAIDCTDLSLEDDHDVDALSRDVGKCTAGAVELARVRRTDGTEEGGDIGRLVARDSEQGRETAAGEVGCYLGRAVLCSTDRGDAEGNCKSPILFRMK